MFRILNLLKKKSNLPHINLRISNHNQLKTAHTHTKARINSALVKKNHSQKHNTYKYNRISYFMGAATAAVITGWTIAQSFEKAESKESEALNDVLNKYKNKYEHNPTKLINAIPPTQIWRFLIDGKDQTNGMLGYDTNEPGYLNAMSKAFQEIFLPTKNLNTLIKKLHLLATTDVENLLYSTSKIDAPGEFRNHLTSKVGNLNHVMSTSGIDEILAKIKYMSYSDNSVLAIELSDDKNNPTYIIPDKLSYTDKNQLHVSRTAKLILQQTLQNEGKVMLVMQAHTNKNTTDNDNTIAESLNTRMEKLIARYQHQMNHSITKISQLKTIIAFIQECELIHPFRDGNTRTFSILLRNHLLIENGFPPVIDDNPNRVYAHSREELLNYTIEGMNRTLMLAEGIEPYKPAVEELRKKLTYKQNSYFQLTVDNLSQFQAKMNSVNASEHAPILNLSLRR